MNRRDIIILATVVNAVLLLVLFTTAQRPNKHVDFPVTSLPVKMMEVSNHQPSHKTIETSSKVEVKKTKHQPEVASVRVKENNEDVVQLTRNQNEQASTANQAQRSKATIEVSSSETVSVSTPTKVASSDRIAEPGTTNHNNQRSSQSSQDASDQYTTIVVKKGDFLERIAKANHTTVAVLMQINDLSSTQLKIGQVIKVPVSNTMETQPQVKVSNPNDYYVVKEGDSPWGIALRNGIRLNDLLQMNDLDEQKARKLRPGDRLRIR